MACTLTPEEIKSVKALGFLHNRGTNKFNGRILTINGKITSQQNICLSEAAEKFGQGLVTFTTRLTVEVPGIDFNQIEAFRAYLAQTGLNTGGTGAKVRPVVACKGSTCVYGLCDTFGLSEEIHHRFFVGYGRVMLPHKFKIAVGGCPNNCVKPDLNDVGLVGQVKPVVNQELCRGCKKCAVEISCPVQAAKMVDGLITMDANICNNCGRCRQFCKFGAVTGESGNFKIYLGGRWGKLWSRGLVLSQLVDSKDEAMDIVEKIILFFRDKGQPGERLAETVARIGFDQVEALIYSDELLQRKEAILEPRP